MAKLMTWKVWLAIAFLAMAVLAINPTLNAEGIVIKTVSADSILSQQGMSPGELLISINDQEINTLEDFNNAINKLERETQIINVETDKASHTYNITNSLGFSTNENLTIIDAEMFTPLEKGEQILAIESILITNITELKEAINKIMPKEKISVTTDKGSYIYLGAGAPEITAMQATTTNLKKGLDLEGGTRVLLKPISETGEVTTADMNDMIKVLNNRLNVYGLSDLRIRSSKDWQGNKYILIEIAGISKDEVMDLIGGQGKFEAKIGEDTVFEGGKKDIPFVCRDDGSCSGIRACNPIGGNQYFCRFEFSIHLSPEAAKKHADITSKLDVITSEEGKEILSEKLDFYLDGKKVDSLNIGADLKGRETTAIAISGPGIGTTKTAAVEAATKNMDQLQTILITGSLPMQLEVEKLDSISPLLGKQFVKTSLLVGILAILSVAVVLMIRYRSLKIAFPIAFTSLSEVIMILGFAALTGWNLDMAAIAGIIAAVGVGVDAQIIILDETIRGEASTTGNWKSRVKNAFFIIFAAYATTVAAMIPLWNAGAGMLRGFALTTIVGVTIAVLITRPAYADIVKALYEK
ncbi:MAG: hypothetical protein ABIH53_03445 [archaeon]